MKPRLQRAEDRLILALDVPSLVDAEVVLERARPYNIKWVKIGLELLMSVGAPRTIQFLKQDKDMNVFCDGKFFDVPNTIDRAVHGAVKNGADMFDVSVNAGPAALKRAVRQKKESIMLVNTLLSSLNVHDMFDIGYVSPDDFCHGGLYHKEEASGYMHALLREMATLTRRINADGITCPAQDLSVLDGEEFDGLLKVATGIRLKEDTFLHSHKRFTTPREAMHNGADMIVLGAPFNDFSIDDASFRGLLEKVFEEMVAGFADRGILQF